MNAGISFFYSFKVGFESTTLLLRAIFEIFNNENKLDRIFVNKL